MLEVAVVIAAHRNYATLELCLNGFLGCVDKPQDIIFVDNGSGGLLVDCLVRKYSDITLISLPENRNFCGGFNAGIRVAIARDYKYVLIVNADTEVYNRNFLSALVTVMKRNQDVAFLGPKVFFRSTKNIQNTIFNFPTLHSFVINWFLYRLYPRILNKSDNTERIVDVLNGVCVLCRIDALKEVGLMDEVFGAYVEDTDWAWRANRLRWHSMYTPVESIIHHEEPSGYEQYSMKTFLLKRNFVFWFLKTDQVLIAYVYAYAALVLSLFRRGLATSKFRQRYDGFHEQLYRAFKGLLQRKALGPWFGAPLDIPGYGELLIHHRDSQAQKVPYLDDSSDSRLK